jgi:hypothetical protein
MDLVEALEVGTVSSPMFPVLENQQVRNKEVTHMSADAN